MGKPLPTLNVRVPAPTRCNNCSTFSATARIPVPRAATEGMRHKSCKRSVNERACRSTYRSKRAKVIGSKLQVPSCKFKVEGSERVFNFELATWNYSKN